MYTSLLLWLACTLASAAALRFFLRLRFLGASGTAATSMFGKEDLEGEVGLVACEMRSARAPGIGRSQRAWDRTFTVTGRSQRAWDRTFTGTGRSQRAWDRAFTGTGRSQDLLPLELRHQPPSCLEINAKGLDELLGDGHALLATGGHE